MGELSDEELVKLATEFKNEANELFKGGKNQDATQKYLKGIDEIVKVRTPTEESKKLAIVLYQNVSLSLNKLEKYRMAFKNCTKALEIDENAVKALYIRAQAYFGLKMYDEAIADIKSAIKLSP